MDYSPFYLKNYYTRNKKQGGAPVGYAPVRGFSAPPPTANAREAEPDYYEPPAAAVPVSPAASYAEDYDARAETAAAETGEHIPKDERRTKPYGGSAVPATRAQAGYASAADPAADYPARRAAPRPKKKREGLFVVVVILLSFAIVVAGAELLTGGLIMEGLKAAVNGEAAPSYYLLSSRAYTSESEAKTQSLIAREMGGAGYIYTQDSQYYVVIATYFDKKTAESVKKKNGDLNIIEVTECVEDCSALSVKEREVCEKARTEVRAALAVIYENANHLDGNKAGISEVLTTVTGLRNDMLMLKAEVSDSTLPQNIKNRLYLCIDPVFGGLDAIVSMNANDLLAASLRNVCASTIAALCYNGA